MFEDLGPRDDAVFCDVAYDEYRHARCLGAAQQCGGAFAYLRDAAGRRLDRLGVHCLYRVYDDHLRARLVDLCDDVLQLRLGIYDALLVGYAQTRGAHLDLLGRLLARDVERPEAVVAERHLQRQRGLAYARLAAKKDQRSRHQTAAQYAVQLAYARVDAFDVALADLLHALRLGARHARPAKVFHSPHAGHRPSHLGDS